MGAHEIVGSYIIEKSYELARKMNEELDSEFVRSTISPQELDQLNQWRAQFINYIGQAIQEQSSKGVWDQTTVWAKQSGEAAVARGINLDDALNTLTSWRTATWEAVLDKLDEVDLSNREIIEIGFVIDPIIDHAGQVFSIAFVNNYREHIKKAQSSIIEFSVPVVGLSNNVAILPLIGELDDERAKILKEVALNKCLELRVTTLILDLSGVPMVDTMVANELSQVIDSLKLIGVQTVLTGLRPEIAQAVIEIGIKFDNMTILKDLKRAIEFLQKEGSF